jgi:hypothetical protein
MTGLELIAIGLATVATNWWVRRRQGSKIPKPVWCRSVTTRGLECAYVVKGYHHTSSGLHYRQVWSGCLSGFCNTCCRYRGCGCSADDVPQITS